MKRRVLKEPVTDSVPYEDNHRTSGRIDYHQGTKAWLESLSRQRRPPGRPIGDTPYKEYFPEIVFQLRLLGATDNMIADACHVERAVIRSWLKLDSGKDIFRDAYQLGGELADARVAESMYHRAIGYTHPDEKIMSTRDEGIVRVPTMKHYPPDSSAGIFWLTNRQKGKWHNRVSNEVTGADGQPLQPPQLIVTGVTAPHRHPAALERDMKRTNGTGNGADHSSDDPT